MRVNTILWGLFVTFVIGGDGGDVSDEKETSITPKEKTPPESVEMPEALTINDFDKITSEQLSFVEFFSPYCSHCKQLAPTWERTYKNFYDDLKSMNVQMRQVNCVESGDLCEREDVFGYPSLRIYAPVHDRETGQMTGKSKLISDYPRSLVRTEENFKKFVRNAVADYDTGSVDLPSASRELTPDRLLQLIGGKAEQPEFVMFYPGTEKQWKDSEAGRSGFSKTCYNCMENKRLWDKFSNTVLTTVGTNHFSCVTHPEMCANLGLKLSDPTRNPPPKFMMFLPEKVGKIRFDYKGPISIESLKAFASGLYKNSQYEIVSPKTLSEIMDFRKSLPKEPLNSFYPLPNKIAIVFYYDPRTVTDEDRAILPYLLDYVTNSPFNIHLYTAKSIKYEGALNAQAGNILEYIKTDDQEKKPFNKARYLSTTLTTKPTIFVIKDNTLFTSVFQSYAPEDIRDEKKVIDFIESNKFPLYQELTPQLYEYYFPEKAPASNKVVVTFIDSQNAKKTDEILYQLSLAAHEYHELKNEYYFDDLLSKRNAKAQRVAELKKQNANSVAIIKEMRKEIPHLYDNNGVLFTFIDIAQNPTLANDHGWNINSKDYKPGDSIVVSQDKSYYWDQTISGEDLTENRKSLVDILTYLLDPKLITTTPVSITKKLVASPYPKFMRPMDHVHEKGLLGYGFIICLIIAVFKFVNRPKKASGPIIGNLDKAD
ncbi:ER-retained PMA1-suppressing protein 1 [[Candida] jaroonii]|uniref:ER-retained PMA1-suppressing protein 1 n=1 Tax=[Candida] jaroonii TaxID=467808 RepID=A0ACA9Y661_9ASCO|nr:ER-retained PMA1-suppressing protein 1 [[Candida] jaroonii]